MKQSGVGAFMRGSLGRARGLSSVLSAGRGAVAPSAENSPALQGWVAGPGPAKSRQGRKKFPPRSFVSAGLAGRAGEAPSPEGLGYFQTSSLPDVLRQFFQNHFHRAVDGPEVFLHHGAGVLTQLRRAHGIGEQLVQRAFQSGGI